MTNTITWTMPPPIFSNEASEKFHTREEMERIHREAERAAEEAADVGFIEGTQNFMQFIEDVKDEGVFMALWDKPFAQLLGELFRDIFHALGVFVMGNGDIFFLLPALVFMVGTFMVGRNKFTKWIVPLWFFYFLSRVFFRMLVE